MSEEVSKVSGASKQANEQASGPVFQSVSLVVLAHSATLPLLELTNLVII